LLSGSEFWITTTAGSPLETYYTFPLDSNWHYIVGLYDGTNQIIYVDGIQVSISNRGAVTLATTGGSYPNLHIGRYYYNTSWNYVNSGSMIDEVRIYNRALTQAEITDLYNNYGYTTINYPGREIVSTYMSNGPTNTIGTEQTSTDITATAMTITPNETPCRHNICTVTVSVTWTNNGGISESFVPNITIDTVPISPAPYLSESLAPTASVTKSFVISNLAVGTHNICPYPN